MTTPTTISTIPTRKIFQRIELNTEIETAIQLGKFEDAQRKEGRAEETVRSRIQALKQVARICNLDNPEEVKKWLACLIETNKCAWNDKTKTKFCDTYGTYLKFRGIAC